MESGWWNRYLVRKLWERILITIKRSYVRIPSLVYQWEAVSKPGLDLLIRLYPTGSSSMRLDDCWTIRVLGSKKRTKGCPVIVDWPFLNFATTFANKLKKNNKHLQRLLTQNYLTLLFPLRNKNCKFWNTFFIAIKWKF